MSGLVGSLTVDGLPPLRWQAGFGWYCDITIPAWTGFATFDGPPDSGAVCVSFFGSDVLARTPPSAGQVSAFRRLTERNGEPIRDAVLRAAFDYLSGPDAEDDFADMLVEPLVELEQLRQLMALSTVGVLADETDGESWLDLELACAWDPGHSMALVVGGRVSVFGDR